MNWAVLHVSRRYYKHVVFATCLWKAKNRKRAQICDMGVFFLFDKFCRGVLSCAHFVSTQCSSPTEENFETMGIGRRHSRRSVFSLESTRSATFAGEGASLKLLYDHSSFKRGILKDHGKLSLLACNSCIFYSDVRNARLAKKSPVNIWQHASSRNWEIGCTNKSTGWSSAAWFRSRSFSLVRVIHDATHAGDQLLSSVFVRCCLPTMVLDSPVEPRVLIHTKDLLIPLSGFDVHQKVSFEHLSLFSIEFWQRFSGVGIRGSDGRFDP